MYSCPNFTPVLQENGLVFSQSESHSIFMYNYIHYSLLILNHYWASSTSLKLYLFNYNISCFSWLLICLSSSFYKVKLSSFVCTCRRMLVEEHVTFSPLHTAHQRQNAQEWCCFTSTMLYRLQRCSSFSVILCLKFVSAPLHSKPFP